MTMPTTDKLPNQIDHLIGRSIRRERLLKGLTQSRLAHAVDISFQQLQKYESGLNRIPASRLVCIAQTLHISIDTFFDGIDTLSPADQGPCTQPPIDDRQIARLVAAFSRIHDPKLRSRIASLVEESAPAATPRPPGKQDSSCNALHAESELPLKRADKLPEGVEEKRLITHE
jgi:transcriptional regulator with XRE-family HTH domain